MVQKVLGMQRVNASIYNLSSESVVVVWHACCGHFCVHSDKHDVLRITFWA